LEASKIDFKLPVRNSDASTLVASEKYLPIFLQKAKVGSIEISKEFIQQQEQLRALVNNPK
jgi:SAM-dependent MidA family methyltransferase